MTLRHFSSVFLALLLAACAGVPPRPTPAPAAICPAPAACPAPVSCAPCAEPGVVKPAEKAWQTADWAELPGWSEDDPRVAFEAFLASCPRLLRPSAWQAVCAAAPPPGERSPPLLRQWFEANFRPWAMSQQDGNRTGLITGYYEPVLQGSRSRSAKNTVPVFGPPDDMITVELGEVYPELKHMRLRGRLEGRKLIPYYSRADWEPQESKRSPILWVDDAVELFFMQIQGSGQVRLADGSRVRLNYADQNGHPYRSIGKWLIDKGELNAHEASMQGIKTWVRANPGRRSELLNVNPSLVFFREMPADGSGPTGALNQPLTPQRSLAVDARHIPLGAPVWLATTHTNSEKPLQRLMLAHDTGGAIRGPVRADFYWGTGDEAGAQAGKMRQTGRLWALLPKDWVFGREP